MFPLLLTAFAAEPILLDAGPLADHVMEGFVRLDLEGCADLRARWEVPPDKAIPGAFPDPLAGDALVGGRLHLDLEPGRWHVWVMLGQEAATLAEVTQPFGLRSGDQAIVEVTPPTLWADWLASPFGSANPRPVFRPDETAWDRQLRPTHPWREAEIEVGAGGLDLQAFGRPLQAIVLAPAAQVDTTRVALALTDDLRKDWFHRYFYPQLREPTALPTTDTLTLAAWDEPTGAPARSWSPTLARDERHGAVLWLPGDGPAEVEVDGLPGLTVELYEVSWLDAAQHAARPTRVRPAVLIPREGRAVALTGGQGLPTGLALVLRSAGRTAPDATASFAWLSAPGLHRGRVTLTQGGERWRLDLKVRVLDLTLPPPPAPAGFIWLASPAAAKMLPTPTDLRDLPIGGPPLHRVLDEELARMEALGATAITLKGALDPDQLRKQAPERAAALAVHLLQRWADHGGTIAQWADPKMIIRQSAFVHPAEDPLPDSLTPTLQALLAIPSRAPIRVVIPVWEEEGGWKNAGALPIARALMPQLKALAPDVRFAANAGHPLDHAVAGLIDVVTLGNLPTLRRSIVEQVRTSGSTPWAYNLAPAETGPLAAWANGVEAFVQWHWSPAMVDPLHDVHQRPVWWYAARGPDGQVWHTALAERFAAGITLTRWLALIEQQLREAPDAEAQALIDALRASLDGPMNNSTWDGEMLAPAAVAALRPALVETATRLGRR
jgi:hypothetical protein